MANKKFWLGMLVMILTFGLTVIGCEEEDEPEPDPQHNIFYGDWSAQTLITNVSSLLSSEAVSAGIGYSADSNSPYIKVDDKWYHWESPFGSTFVFSDSTYTEKKSITSSSEPAVSYTFDSENIIVNGDEKSYTRTFKIFVNKYGNSERLDILEWDNMVLTSSNHHYYAKEGKL
jgi:hypothetical protein